MQLKHLTLVLLLLRYILSSPLKEINKCEDNFSFLINNKLFLRPNEVVEIGLFFFNSTENDVTFKQWNRHTRQAGGVKILTKIPKIAYMPKFSDTIIFLDTFNENTSANLQPLLNQRNIWEQESRYTLVLTSEFKEDQKVLKYYVKLLWFDAKLINFLVVCKDSFDKVQMLTYNPFKDEILNFTTLRNYTPAELFPNKVKNLYGYTLNVSYVLSQPYAYKRHNQILGVDYDFTTTFLKAINASIRTMEKPNYAETAKEVFYGSADIAAASMFLYEESMNIIAYPHGFMDNIVLVQKPHKVPPLASLAQICDVYTWSMIVATLMIFKVLKLFWVKILTGGEDRLGMKILTIAFAVYSIIVLQVIQSLITTFLIYPKPVKMINTINDLVESKLPIHVYSLWQPHLTTKLANQYILEDEDYIPKIMNNTATDAAYVVPNVEEGNYVNKKYHRVQEPIGTNYMMFYLGHHSPYKAVLKDIILRGLACGFFSRDWGNSEEKKPRKTKTFKNLKLKHLEGVFIVWYVGIILSLVVFIGEIVWYRWVTRHRGNC